MGFFDPNIDKLAKNKDLEGLIKAMLHKKKEVRESSGSALSKIRSTAERLEICTSLTQLIEECDWYRAIDIVTVLGKMRCKMATNTISDLVHIALREYEKFSGSTLLRGPATEHLFEGTSSTILQSGDLRVNTDTDSPPLAPCPLYSRFIHFAVAALGNIGDPGVEDTLRAVMKNKSMDKWNREMAKKVLDKIKEGKIKEKTRPKKTPPKVKVAYFECDVPSGDGVCSDNNCPCLDTVIPRGTGYLYVDQALVDFRRKYPSMKSAREALQQKQEDMRVSGTVFAGFYRLGPILVCEQGAKLRNLDLKVAATDAKHWWETGKVPLRATPTAKSHK